MLDSFRFSHVWWHYTDNGEEINYFVFNKQATKILDIKTEKVYDIDTNNFFKSIRKVYGKKGRIDDTLTVLTYYIYKNGTKGYIQTNTYGEYYKYVDKKYLENFEKRLKDAIIEKQNDMIASVKLNEHNNEFEF